MSIKLGLIGCGYWGRNYLSTLRDADFAETRLVCDIVNIPKKEAMPYGTVFTRDYQDVLNNSEIQGVIISTPSSTHYELALAALKKGKDVLVEKPITTDSRQAQALIEAANSAGKTLMVGHIFKYNPAVQFIKKKIEQGEIGDMRYIEARRVGLGPIRSDVNSLWDLGTHDIYLSTHLTGEMPESASYTGTSHNGQVDDISVLNLKFPNKILATIYTNWGHPQKERRLVVGGTKKAISFDDIEPVNKVSIFDVNVSYEPLYRELEGGQANFQASTRSGDITLPLIPVKQPLLEELRHFVECVEGKAKCLSDGLDGLNTIRVLEAADKSRQLNGLETRI